MRYEIKPIHTEDDLDAALTRIDALMNTCVPGTIEGDELEVLIILVEAYEAKHHAIDSPDPIEAIKFRLDQEGKKPADLISLIGSAGRVSEVLNGRRPLTLPMIRRISSSMGIAAEVLIAPSRPSQVAERRKTYGG